MGEIKPEVVPQPPADQVDDAALYLKDHQNEALDSQVDLSALRRKIDRRLMPYMFCCYVLQFLDKVMLNVSHFQFSRMDHVINARVYAVCSCYGDQKRLGTRRQ